MHPVFVPLGPEHADGVMRIFNHYCVHSFAAFASRELPVSFYGKFLELSAGYPAYAVTADSARLSDFVFSLRTTRSRRFRRPQSSAVFLRLRFGAAGLVPRVWTPSVRRQKRCTSAPSFRRLPTSIRRALSFTNAADLSGSANFRESGRSSADLLGLF